MSGWMIFVNFMLPVAFFTLLLFSIPFPNFIGRYRNKFLKGIGNIRLPYTEINIITFLAILSILLFIGTGLTVLKHSNDSATDRHDLLLNNARAVLWRAERNFWISACNLVMYWSIYVLFTIQNKLNDMYDHKCLLENKIIQLNDRTVVSTGTNTNVPELEINMETNNNENCGDLEGLVAMDGVRKRCRNNDIKDV